MRYYTDNETEGFYELLKNNAMKEEGDACFTFYEYENEIRRDVKLTRKEVLHKSLKIANELKERGAKKGDRVIILSTQTPDNVLSVAASLLSGTVFTIVPPPIDASKMMRFKSVVESCEPQFILYGNLLEGKIQKIIADLKEDVAFGKILKDVQIVNVEKSENDRDFTPQKIDLDDLIYIQYTSGSTSAPKGVMITYGNLLSAVKCAFNRCNDVSRIVSWVPFFHNLGLVYAIFLPIINPQISIGVMSPNAFLEKPERWIRALSDFKADTTIAPNSAYNSYPKLVPASSLKDIDLSNLKRLINGSEIVAKATLDRFTEEYKCFGVKVNKFSNGYGLSEATCGISDSEFIEDKDVMTLDFDAYKNRKYKTADKDSKDTIQFVSCGVILDKTIVKIVNPDTLKECKEDEFGEIWIQAPYIAKGYYKNEKATEETFKAELDGYEGYFLRTGDMGIIKNDRVFITGRIKELIIVNGNNILPNDIVVKLQETINEVKLADIVPFSVMADKKEKLVILIGMPEQLLNKINTEEVKNKINECVLKNFEVSPYDVKFVDRNELPKSDNGKISIKKAAKMYEENDLNSNSKVVIDYKTKIEFSLGEIIKSEFSHEASRDQNLLSLGMDSLEVVGLAKNIEKTFSVSVPVSFIFESPFISKISEYIDRSLNGEDLSKLEKDKSYLYNEVKLDESITPGKYETGNPEMKNVFITGTTGFVGAYLISSFNKYTDAKLYCHVRAKDKKAGFERIKKNMEYYHLWKEEYKDIIIPVTGSLDEPLLGIDKEEYDFLAENIDTIIHNGAVLNFIYPYERLKETNVNGTVKALALACTGKPKYFNYISSYSVFDNPSHFKKHAVEDDELKDCRGYYLSYSESKWVAENIIHIARERGLKAAIYRPGEITGANDTGIWKLSDSISRLIKSIFVTGTYPDIPMEIHMTQVDYITDAIVNIAKREDSYGKAFNLMNDVHVPIKWIGDTVNELGYNAKKVSYDEWKQIIFKSGNEHPLKLLESLFKIKKKNPEEDFVNRYGKMSPIYDDTRNVQKALEGTGIECEHMNSELLKKYVVNFIDK